LTLRVPNSKSIDCSKQIKRKMERKQQNKIQLAFSATTSQGFLVCPNSKLDQRQTVCVNTTS
jgi:hypothetical protein